MSCAWNRRVRLTRQLANVVGTGLGSTSAFSAGLYVFIPSPRLQCRIAPVCLQTAGTLGIGFGAAAATDNMWAIQPVFETIDDLSGTDPSTNKWGVQYGKSVFWPGLAAGGGANGGYEQFTDPTASRTTEGYTIGGEVDRNWIVSLVNIKVATQVDPTIRGIVAITAEFTPIPDAVMSLEEWQWLVSQIRMTGGGGAMPTVSS